MSDAPVCLGAAAGELRGASPREHRLGSAGRGAGTHRKGRGGWMRCGGLGRAGHSSLSRRVWFMPFLGRLPHCHNPVSSFTAAPPADRTAPSLHCCRRYNKEGLRLRIFYLLNQPPGAESHTVLVQVRVQQRRQPPLAAAGGCRTVARRAVVAATHLLDCRVLARQGSVFELLAGAPLQDVPGVAYGTIPQRADGTLLKIIPKSEFSFEPTTSPPFAARLSTPSLACPPTRAYPLASCAPRVSWGQRGGPGGAASFPAPDCLHPECAAPACPPPCPLPSPPCRHQGEGLQADRHAGRQGQGRRDRRARQGGLSG